MRNKQGAFGHEEESEEILDFLESVHQRYDREKRTLIRTFRNNQRAAAEQKRQLRINPPKPKDIVIRFGRVEELPSKQTSKQ